MLNTGILTLPRLPWRQIRAALLPAATSLLTLPLPATTAVEAVVDEEAAVVEAASGDVEEAEEEAEEAAASEDVVSGS